MFSKLPENIKTFKQIDEFCYLFHSSTPCYAPNMFSKPDLPSQKQTEICM